MASPPRFPARIGAVLASPAYALAEAEAAGGGLRDAIYLALVGVACFWLRDLAEAVLGLSHLPITDVLGRLLQLASLAFREGAMVILPAAVLLTVLAGRGRRDPSKDVELAALCYVPFFAVMAVQRTLALDALLGPFTMRAHQLWQAAGVAWALVVFGFALRVVRRRPTVVPAKEPGVGPRVAVTALAFVLGVAVFVNATWVVRNAHAVRPFGEGDAVPAFTLDRANGPGGQLSLESLRGKVVLLDFWASWCMPCLKLAPVLHDVHREWAAKGFEVVSINIDLSMSELQDFLKVNPAPYPVLMADADGRVAEQFKVVNLPHLVILDQQGHAAQTFWGWKSRSQIENVVRGLIERKPQ
ncbi:MAG: redoxin domain-containing protein [Deltaproteobacteria bacterium]|nr:redoxin domain-containing protein [Deltaproteobacteria bacterium]